MSAKSADGRRTVLLVDDDADFVGLNRAALEKAGFRVLTAYNRDEGLAQARAAQPDLIVLDVMMAAETDGFHAAYELRQGAETRDIPILMVTSVNESVPFKFDKDETWLPVDSFIEKPIKPDDLVRKVKEKLG